MASSCFFIFLINFNYLMANNIQNIFVYLLRIVLQPIAIEKTLKKYQNNEGCQNNGKVSK